MVKHLRKKFERNNKDLAHLKVEAGTKTCIILCIILLLQVVVESALTTEKHALPPCISIK